jgi:hypothetical protein
VESGHDPPDAELHTEPNNTYGYDRPSSIECSKVGYTSSEYTQYSPQVTRNESPRPLPREEEIGRSQINNYDFLYDEQDADYIVAPCRSPAYYHSRPQVTPNQSSHENGSYNQRLPPEARNAVADVLANLSSNTQTSDHGDGGGTTTDTQGFETVKRKKSKKKKRQLTR